MKDVMNNDEREGKYRFMYEYNSETNTKMKEGITVKPWVEYLNKTYQFVVIIVVVTVMLFFENLTYDEVTAVDSSAVTNAIL